MRFFPVLLTVFIDSLGFGLIVPLMAPILIESSHFLGQGCSSCARGWSYSFLVASYCFGQFFGGPILGALADRMGRKKVLLATLLLAFMGYLLGAISISFFSLAGLFASRIILGVAAGNFSLAQSYIADESKAENKSRNFALLGMAWGSGFVLGPFLGGRCIDSSVCSFFSLITPFLVAALLCLFNLAVGLCYLRESSFVKKLSPLSFFTGCVDVKKAFSHPKLQVIFIVMFIFSFGWGFFTEFSSVFLINRLGFQVEDISNFFAWVGLWIALCQGVLIRPVLKRFSSPSILVASLFIFSLILLSVGLVQNAFSLFAIVPFLAFFESLIYPSAAALISNIAPEDSQGEILGIYNSVQWAAIGLTPFLSGGLIMKYTLAPVVVASFSMMLAFSIFARFMLKNKENVFSDLP